MGSSIQGSLFVLMKLHEFNQAPGKPIVNLAYANGFPPETYKFMLEPLFDRYRVVSIQERPLWGDRAPESIQQWSQLADDLLAGGQGPTQHPTRRRWRCFRRCRRTLCRSSRC